MPLIKYQDVNFSAARLAKIAQANEIIDAYAAQGYDLTLRQLFYQFVSRGWIPNKQKEYTNLGRLINAPVDETGEARIDIETVAPDGDEREDENEDEDDTEDDGNE